jgi:hypothetical protein
VDGRRGKASTPSPGGRSGFLSTQLEQLSASPHHSSQARGTDLKRPARRGVAGWKEAPATDRGDLEQSARASSICARNIDAEEASRVRVNLRALPDGYRSHCSTLMAACCC